MVRVCRMFHIQSICVVCKTIESYGRGYSSPDTVSPIEEQPVPGVGPGTSEADSNEPTRTAEDQKVTTTGIGH